jgi:hypothetical protein
MEKKIFSDEEVFEQIKPASRKAYKKCWKEFKEINPEINFEEGPPLERKPSSSSSSILDLRKRLPHLPFGLSTPLQSSWWTSLAGKTGPCARSTSLPASQPSWAWQAGLGGLRLSLKTL